MENKKLLTMENMDELLAKYLLGEASDKEKTAIDEWLNAAAANQQYFDHFKLIWQTGELLKVESKLDPEQEWAEFKALATSKDIARQPNAIRPFTHWMRIAAVWAVLIGAAALAYVYFYPHTIKTLTFQTANLVKIDTLPDGSIITLNKNSAIVYPDRFTGGKRAITLSYGEAFFNIAHDASKPFLIHVNDAVVRVVGTSFNIQVGQGRTEVVVETGVVQVIRKKVVVKLKPKEKASIDYQSGEVKKSQSTDEFYNYYRTNRLVADNTPLWRVAEVLSQVYHVNITIANNKLGRRTLNTILNTTSLDSNLNIIAETFKVQIIRKPGKIIIQ